MTLMSMNFGRNLAIFEISCCLEGLHLVNLTDECLCNKVAFHDGFLLLSKVQVVPYPLASCGC